MSAPKAQADPNALMEVKPDQIDTRKNPDLQLKSGIAQMQITFSSNQHFRSMEGDYRVDLFNDHDFTPPPNILKAYPANMQMYGNLRKSISFRFTDKRMFRVSENYLYQDKDFIKLSISYPLSQLTVLQCSPDDDYDADFKIVMKITGSETGRYFALDNDRPEFTKQAQGGNPVARDRWVTEYTQLGKKVPDPQGKFIPESDYDIMRTVLIHELKCCSYVRIIIRNYKSIYGKAHFFSPNLAQQILDAKDTESMFQSPQGFCQMQRKAIQAESTRAEMILQGVARKAGDVRARVVLLAEFDDRYALRLEPKPNDQWQVPEKAHVYIRAQGSDAGILTTMPGKIPNQPKGQENCWQGTTFMADKTVHCSLENFITSAQKKQLQQLSQQKAEDVTWLYNFHVQFTEGDDESVVSRQMVAINALEHGMRVRAGAANSEDKPEIKTDYHQPIDFLLLGHGNESTKDDPIETHRALEAMFSRPSLQMQQASHQAAASAVFAGKKKRSIVQGPPATGKTTLNSKIIWLLMRAAKFAEKQGTGGAIITAAHTNEAVRVACRRTLELGPTFGFNEPWRQICLVVSEQMLNHWRMTGHPLHESLQLATLGAHLERLVTESKNPSKWATFSEGRRQIKKSGRYEFDANTTRQYRDQERQLIERLKQTIRIWFCTLSTLHLRHPVFGIQSPSGAPMEGLDTRVLVIDEASQATDVYVAMAILTTNPRHLSMTGDHNQLAPFHSTPEGERAWQKSTFERLQNITDKVLLDVEYRTRSNIYAGTNYLYQNRVFTADGVDDRPAAHNIDRVIKNITFQIDNGPHVSLTSNVHVFDLSGTKCEQTASKSSRNGQECQIMRGLMGALRMGGIPLRHLMALTPYQGQWDEMVAQMSSSFWREAQLRKIDSAQGDEAEVVLFSATRTKETGLGFLHQSRRQNVAMSRAKNALFAFIDMDMVRDSSTGQAWQRWFNNLLQKNPKNLVLRMHPQVTWYYQGRKVTAQTVQNASEIDIYHNDRPRASSVASHIGPLESGTLSPFQIQQKSQIGSPRSGVASPGGVQSQVRSPLSGHGQQMPLLQKNLTGETVSSRLQPGSISQVISQATSGQAGLQSAEAQPPSQPRLQGSAPQPPASGRTRQTLLQDLEQVQAQIQTFNKTITAHTAQVPGSIAKLNSFSDFLGRELAAGRLLLPNITLQTRCLEKLLQWQSLTGQRRDG
ncbi:hypothetical protein H2198_009294 [Neophaeococcomyces mojaviensis]|uniref:Uncharacterized protein n=1 Tax=Neophaeococcomyces mojaviensis TaxID=3383035 RepID=A0ACC2ZV22_9EURO|nr:hypothetical protein H2198_009294 [Knufia sp. JES_112]